MLNLGLITNKHLFRKTHVFRLFSNDAKNKTFYELLKLNDDIYKEELKK